MPSHKLHRKWAEECGINGELANRVDVIIDDMKHHDAAKVMVTHMIYTEAVVRLIHGQTPREVKESLLKFSRIFPKSVRKQAQYLFTDMDSAVFHNDHVGTVSIGDIFRMGPEVAARVDGKGRRTVYVYQKREIKSLKDLLEV